jgi:hypothetical protein
MTNLRQDNQEDTTKSATARGKAIICEDCEKITQKEVPSNSSSSDGGACEQDYMSVAACMKAFHGQVSPCQELWSAFKKCHDRRKESKLLDD